MSALSPFLGIWIWNLSVLRFANRYICSTLTCMNLPLLASSENGSATCHTSHIIPHTLENADRLLSSYTSSYLPAKNSWADFLCWNLVCDEALIREYVFFLNSALSVIALVCCRITRAITFIFTWEVTRNMRTIYKTHDIFSHNNRVSFWNVSSAFETKTAQNLDSLL